MAKVGKMQNKDFWKKVKIRIALLEHEYDRNLWQKVKNRSKLHEKWSFFVIILPWRAGYCSERSFLLIFIARDDLVKVSCKFDARKCQNQVTLLTLTGWVKGTSPFSNCQTHKKSWQGQNNYNERCHGERTEQGSRPQLRTMQTGTRPLSNWSAA